MSWSTIKFGDHFAHAHDWEQILFMSLAPPCLDSLEEFRDSRWLHEWKDYWIDHKGVQANGCSDIELHTHLDSEEKIAEFRRFLSRYTTWISSFGPEIPVNRINEFIALGRGARMERPCQTDDLRQFVVKILALLDGSEHTSIQPLQSTLAEQDGGGQPATCSESK